MKKIDVVNRKRIGENLKLFSSDPLKYARRLVNSKIGTYRFRIGDFRVIFDLHDDDLVVLRLGHRSKIYK